MRLLFPAELITHFPECLGKEPDHLTPFGYPLTRMGIEPPRGKRLCNLRGLESMLRHLINMSTKTILKRTPLFEAGAVRGRRPFKEVVKVSLGNFPEEQARQLTETTPAAKRAP